MHGVAGVGHEGVGAFVVDVEVVEGTDPQAVLGVEGEGTDVVGTDALGVAGDVAVVDHGLGVGVDEVESGAFGGYPESAGGLAEHGLYVFVFEALGDEGRLFVAGGVDIESATGADVDVVALAGDGGGDEFVHGCAEDVVGKASGVGVENEEAFGGANQELGS